MKGGLFIFLCAILLVACGGQVQTSTLEMQAGEIRVYFTEPQTDWSAGLDGGPDEALVAAIDSARLSVDMAAYNLDLYGIRDALIAAHERGVQVRLVIELDNAASEAVQLVAAAGIPIITDKESDYMHNKFVIIDRYEVWTGSMNYTVGSAYGDRNNLVAVRSTRLAQNYETEFNEMFLQRRFGPSSPADTPFPQLDLSGILVQTYFSPEDQTIGYLLALVESAQESVYFLAFSFTSDPLADVLLRAESRGVEVRGVFDKSQATSNAGGEYERLLNAGLEVRLDGEEGALHDKVLIIDGKIVVTGSYNFSRNAEENNDENTLVIHSTEIAQQYLDEFMEIWELAD